MTQHNKNEMDSSRAKSKSKDSNLDEMSEFDESELEDLYSWIDGIPLTRPKRNISRDFSDGGNTLVAKNIILSKVIFSFTYIMSQSCVIHF